MVFLATGLLLLVLSILPYRSLEATARRRYSVLDAMVLALLLGIFLLSRALRLEIGLPAAFAIFSVVKVTCFCAFCALSDPALVRWSAARAAVLAGSVYLLLIPLSLQTPIDGDEPYYVLLSASIAEDHDVDLRNQYAQIASSPVNRPDLGPQPGDPTGPHGEQYSRHEPFLSVLLIPGFLFFGVPGAVGTIALFGALLVRSFFRVMEEERTQHRVSWMAFWFFAFGSPVLFYSLRIWPEVPAAFFFLESVRAIRNRREKRFVPAILGLVLLKLRFGLIAVVLVPMAIAGRRRWKLLVMLAILIALPSVILWILSGNPLSVHRLGELLPSEWWKIGRGLFGILLDGSGGMLVQAPILLAGVLATSRWSELPRAARIGFAASVLYLFALAPREEWHGGWSPPLRYVVVFAPVLMLAATVVMNRVRSRVLWLLLVLWTAILSIHGLVYPWRLFHIASGENFVGEWLSKSSGSDFSRIFPSFIRPNLAATVATASLLLIFVGFALTGRASARLRIPDPFIAGGLSLLLAGCFFVGMSPSSIVEMEDAHVVHEGGELYPPEWTVARFRFRGGWTFRTGDSASFLYRGGPSLLRYREAGEAVVRVNGRVLRLPSAGEEWASAALDVPATKGRTRLVMLKGGATIDRLESR